MLSRENPGSPNFILPALIHCSISAIALHEEFVRKGIVGSQSKPKTQAFHIVVVAKFSPRTQIQFLHRQVSRCKKLQTFGIKPDYWDFLQCIHHLQDGQLLLTQGVWTPVFPIIRRNLVEVRLQDHCLIKKGGF